MSRCGPLGNKSRGPVTGVGPGGSSVTTGGHVGRVASEELNVPIRERMNRGPFLRLCGKLDITTTYTRLHNLPAHDLCYAPTVLS